ncbi:MAG TPA: hypothetical protein DDX72_07480 [Ruminococcaceae bacterium]|nr:hypothetical protein [Oscillospiraceae bacterium]
MNELTDRLMKALGDIGEDLIEKAAPVYPADSEAGESIKTAVPAVYEPEVKITRKDRVIYWVTRSLGIAAAVTLIAGAAVLLVQNWDKIAVSGNERPGTIVKYYEELPDISDAYGKTIEFSDASVRFSSVTYDGTRLNTNFYLLYKGNDEFYSPAVWINVEGAEHGDPSCGINPVMEADSYDYLIQSSVPVDLEPGKSYAINIVYKGSGNLENDTQKYRFNCPDIPAVTAETTTNDPYLTSAVEPLIEPDLPIAEFDYDDMKLVVTKYEFDGSTMNIYYDVVFSENLGAENERMKSEIPALTFLIFSEYRQKIDTVSESENSLSMVRTITIDEPQDSVAVQCFPKIYTGQITQELWDKYTFTAVKNAENVEPALKEWTTAKKTFDIEYYNPDDLPGMAAGGGLPFDGIAADGAAFKSIKPQGAPLAYSYRTDTFFADSDSESYEIIPDDLMEILKDYSDGDSLKYDLGGELPALSSYTMLDDTDLLEEYGTKAYRVSIEYLVSVSQNMENAGYYVRFYRRSEEYTEIRRIIELLWNKHDSSYPFNVFSVQSAGGENEGLMIVADDSLSMPGEQIDVLAQIKQLLAENGLPDKARVEFVTPKQLRSEWVPVALCYNDGTPVDLSNFPLFFKYGGDMFLKVDDGWFSTTNEVADKLDELGKTNAAKAMRGEIGIDNIGVKTKAERELFDLTPLDPNIMGGYGLLGNDVLIRQNITGYDIYLYEPRFSSAVGAVTLLRAALTSYFEGRYRLELCIYGDPRLDPYDAKYTVKIYADRENWDDIKTFLETGNNDSVVWQFEDYQ